MAATQDLHTARRTPQQQRSRERVERILGVAKEQIARSGSDALKMAEVATEAGISIGSLYQYFPDKGAVIAALAERYYEEGRACIRDALAPVADVRDLRSSFNDLVDTYYGLFLAEPAMRDIWSGVQADHKLHQIDLDDSRQSGALLAAAMSRVFPAADPAGLERRAMLVMYLGTATMRLAIAVGREQGDGMVEDYKRMALAELLG